MQRPLFIVIALLLVSSVLTPIFVTSVHAYTCPSPCSLIVNTNVPQSDASVTTTAPGDLSPRALSHTTRSETGPSTGSNSAVLTLPAAQARDTSSSNGHSAVSLSGTPTRT